MAKWFEEWFNFEECLSVYSHGNEGDAVELFWLIIKNTFLNKGSKVLDLACGAGRNSILFLNIHLMLLEFIEAKF